MKSECLQNHSIWERKVHPKLLNLPKTVAIRNRNWKKNITCLAHVLVWEGFSRSGLGGYEEDVEAGQNFDDPPKPGQTGGKPLQTHTVQLQVDFEQELTWHRDTQNHALLQILSLCCIHIHALLQLLSLCRICVCLCMYIYFHIFLHVLLSFFLLQHGKEGLAHLRQNCPAFSHRVPLALSSFLPLPPHTPLPPHFPLPPHIPPLYVFSAPPPLPDIPLIVFSLPMAKALSSVPAVGFSGSLFVWGDFFTNSKLVSFYF